MFLVHRPDITIANGPHRPGSTATAGSGSRWAWYSDFGDPHADEEQFLTAHAYSPLHNLRPGVTYPPVLVMTSDHDDRVVPSHSFTFAARLQEVSDGVALLRVDAASGHKEGRSHDALVAERSDVLCFLSRHTGLRWQ